MALSEAWTAALEALSWVELQGMNEDAALRKTLKQLRVEDRRVGVKAGELLYAVSMRRNALDYLINSALKPGDIDGLDVGLRSFLRLYTYMVHYGGASVEAHGFAEHVRRILGKRRLKPVEEAIDLIPHQEIPWGKLSREEALAYRCFLPIWYVKYIQTNFNELDAADLMSPVETPKYIRINTLRGDGALPPLAEHPRVSIRRCAGTWTRLSNHRWLSWVDGHKTLQGGGLRSSG